MGKGTNFSIIEAAGGTVVLEGRGANQGHGARKEHGASEEHGAKEGHGAMEGRGAKEGHVLMMLRRGMWDLPKGHLEPGETLRECAAREVCEECGLDAAHLRVHECIARTVHISGPDEEKHTTWFRMSYTGDPTRVAPQTEEDITALEWLPPAEALRRAAGSYKTIQEVIAKLIQAI